MLSFDNFTMVGAGRSAQLYELDSTDQQLVDLCQNLQSDQLTELYFHYTHYEDPQDSKLRLLEALPHAKNLRSVKLKGSSFRFKNSEETAVHGVDLLLKGLHSCPNLEYLLIRNYSDEEMVYVYEHLAHLIANSKQLKQLALWDMNINAPQFKLLCDVLAKPGVTLELDLKFDTTLSPENKQLLQQALQANKSLTVLGLIDDSKVSMDKASTATGHRFGMGLFDASSVSVDKTLPKTELRPPF